MHQPTEPAKLATQPNKLPSILFWLIVSAATLFGAFVLPFFFPLHQPVFSAAYTAGENNRVAAIAVAAISVFVAFLYSRFQIGGRLTYSKSAAAEPSRLSPRFLWIGIASIAACTAVLGYVIVHHGTYYADEGYFLTQLRSGIVFHRTIYRDFEFPYGPALYFWPVIFIRTLAPFGVSMAAAYLVSVIAMEALGVGLLFYTINALPMRRGQKVAAFVLLTFCAFDTLLGLNYAVLRCVLPFATVALLTRQKNLRNAMIVACLGELLQLTISPELGFAFGTAAIVYGFYRAFSLDWKWLGVSIAAVAGGGIFVMFIGRAYFLSLHQYANGRDNLILEPQPFVLVFLVAVVALAPLAVASGWRDRNNTDGPNTGMLIALYVATLCMLPVAFSQCDPLHAFVNGVGAYLLSFICINRVTEKKQRIWIAVVALTFAATQFQEFHAFRHEIVRALKNIPEPYDDPDVSAISREIGNKKVTFPWNKPPMQMMIGLTQTGQYLPGYFSGFHGESNAASEKRRIADMRAADFALVPNGQALVYTPEIDNTGIKVWLRFGYRYKARQPPFYEYAMLMDELMANWKPVGIYGPYTLYRKVR